MKHLAKSLIPFRVYCGANIPPHKEMATTVFSHCTCEICKEKVQKEWGSLPDEDPEPPNHNYQEKIYPEFMTKEEFLRPPAKPITSIDLSAISGEAKEIRVDSNVDLTSIVFPESRVDSSGDLASIVLPEFKATKYVMETEKDGERIFHELIVDPDKEEE